MAHPKANVTLIFSKRDEALDDTTLSDDETAVIVELLRAPRGLKVQKLREKTFDLVTPGGLTRALNTLTEKEYVRVKKA